MRIFQPVEDLKPVTDRGLIVSRRYTLASCTEADRNKCPEVTEAKLGDVIRVDLTIIAPHDLYYVSVEDPLPAGAEAIDTGLATTSMLAAGPNLQPRYSDSRSNGAALVRSFDTSAFWLCVRSVSRAASWSSDVRN